MSAEHVIPDRSDLDSNTGESKIPIVVFAQVPPPEHGQSRMVRLALKALRKDTDTFDVHHVNARFSQTLDDIGENSVKKGFLIAGYLVQAIRLRCFLRNPVLYYVPGPAKWSAVIRDWFVLAVLRIFFRRVVFHWHAIGQGEWANGSERVSLPGPQWVDKIARKISRLVLEEPHASIAVSDQSRSDASAIATIYSLVVCNGIEDPCPDYEDTVGPKRRAMAARMKESSNPLFRILFLSHGTEEKGLFDAIEAVRHLVSGADESWRFQFSLAGGVSSGLISRFEEEIRQIEVAGGQRLNISVLGYLGEKGKSEAYANHDIFISPSRWESFGLTTVEAMAHGMFVVAAASDGVRGVLSGEYPYLAPPGDPLELFKSLRDCCNQFFGESALEISAQLRARYLKNFQLDSFDNNLRVALQSACELDRQSLTSSAMSAATSKVGQRIPICVYLADQNPGYDRSFGISRMSHIVLKALHSTGKVDLSTIVSKTSQKAPKGVAKAQVFPWGTRQKVVRFLTDHLHPIISRSRRLSAVNYYPKGYLPLLSSFCSPSVVTIHDTIIQYDEDKYPEWRSPWEYRYWATMLKHTLWHADWIMTVSESSKEQINSFLARHGIPEKKITVTYEPCAYDDVPQPTGSNKEEYVIHLASVEPHKRTAELIRWWVESVEAGKTLPVLHLIGRVPEEVRSLVWKSEVIVKRPFLSDEELQLAYRKAKALILPSEIEGFGLPALEAYYLGTPVCFVKGTSVEEVLHVATRRGGMTLDHPDSLFSALDEVFAMSAEEIRDCGLKLRQAYSLNSVSQRMLQVFQEVSGQYS